MFPSRGRAFRAYSALLDEGFEAGRMSIVAGDEPEGRPPSVRPDDAVAVPTDGHGSIAGLVGESAVGGVAGAAIVAAATTAAARLVLPGVPLPMIIGPLAAAGAALGSIAGALIDVGHHEDDARALDEHVESGRVLVTVLTENERSRAAGLLREYGAVDVREATDG